MLWQPGIGMGVGQKDKSNRLCKWSNGRTALNGKSYGKKKTKEYKAVYPKVVYVPGTTTALSYDSNGKEISRTSMTTAGKETRLQMIPEKLSLRPNSQDLCYVNIDLVGKDGVTKSTEDVPITVTVSGAGSLLALGSAKPNMGECFFADTHTTYYGKALAVIRTGNECGKIHIKASAPNLEDQFIELEVRE